jgi:hypothetical protein
MNHQFYTDLLFEDTEDLSPEQSQILNAHLESCENCRSLARAFFGLEAVLNQADMVEPEPGFTARWQTRLENNRLQAYSRQIIKTSVFVLGGLLLLSGAMLLMIWPLLRTPSLVFWTWVYQLFSLYTYVGAFEDFVASLFRSSMGVTPLIAWVFCLGMLSELAVLWIISYRLITNPRRVIK